MQKDFNNWNIKKTNIDTIEVRPFFHVGEVWYCYLGVNVGYEQDGKGDDFLRPVVILKKFGDTFWGIPLTRTVRPEKPYLYQFSFTEGVVSTAILSQIRLIDARRLAYQTGEMTESEFDELRKSSRHYYPEHFSFITSALRQSRAEAICLNIVTDSKNKSNCKFLRTSASTTRKIDMLNPHRPK